MRQNESVNFNYVLAPVYPEYRDNGSAYTVIHPPAGRCDIGYRLHSLLVAREIGKYEHMNTVLLVRYSHLFPSFLVSLTPVIFSSISCVDIHIFTFISVFEYQILQDRSFSIIT